jgi:prevent-host-death family protein
MEISAKELRGKPGQIISQAARGIEVVITMRGKKMAKLVPYKKSSKKGHSENDFDDEIFGLWKDRNDFKSVDAYVRTVRKRRSL